METQWPLVIFTLCLCLAGGLLFMQSLMALLGKGSAKFPDVEMYFLPVGCQHCANPACVHVCPTGASQKTANGTVQIDKEKCIGCQFCVMACPYGVRYLNEEEGVIEKCTLCNQLIETGDLPQYVTQCSARARWFGDLEKGIAGFQGPIERDRVGADKSYDALRKQRMIMGEYIKPWSESEVYTLPDVGNKPSFRYILRGRKWQG